MENHDFVKNRSPMEYLKIFFRRKWLFISPVFLSVVLSIVACFVLPPTYQSSTVILVEEEKIINPLIKGLAVSTSVAGRIRTLREQILSWNSLVTLTKKLDLAKGVNSQGDFEALILGLRRNILVNLGGHNIIRISYFGDKPEKTQLIAKTLTDIFIEENMRSQTKETDVAIDFIKDQLQVYKRKIKESEIADMEEQLKTFLVDSTEQHPMVKELRQKIEAAKKELGGPEYVAPSTTDQPLTSPVYETIKQELDKIVGEDGLNPQAGAAAFVSNNGENDDPNAAIYKLLLMDKLDSVLARDMRINENIYNMLLQKLETAKITQRLEVSKEGTRYTIIDPPRLPLKPTKPNKLLVIFLGIFFGSCAGTGLVFGKEFMDHSFLDIEDAKQNLDLPILGAISRLTTQEEIDKEKYKKRKLVISTVIGSVVLIVLVMLLSFLRH
jgi:capsular polysaccharide biosynthesis protein